MNFVSRFSFFLCCLPLVLGGFSTNVSAIAPPDGSLIWHTYQGGSDYFDDDDPGDEPSHHSGTYHDRATDMAQDSSGNLYVIGHSSGPWEAPVDALNPVNPHTPVQTWNGELSKDVFVAKFGPDGNLVWHTFVGATPHWWPNYTGFWAGEDEGFGIAVDPVAGAVYITGVSDYTWGSPLVAFHGLVDDDPDDPDNPLRPNQPGLRDAFVARLNSADGALIWNTFVGAYGKDEGHDVAVDSTGNVLVIGGSQGAWGTPVRPFLGGGDAWVAKLDSAGSLIWNTFFGTVNGDSGEGIALDASGNIYVTGNSALSFTDGTFGPDPAHPSDPNPLPVDPSEGGNDGYLAKLDNAGNLLWYTFLGGDESPNTNIEPGFGVDVDNAGHVFVTGRSYSSWGAPLNAYTGGENAFVAKINASTGALLANTFMHRYGRDVAVNGAGHVFVTGMSITGYGSGADAFACELDNDLNLQWCTELFTDAPPEWYQWCDGGDYGYGIVVSPDGYVYTTGHSQYECTPDFFPLTPINHHVDFGETSTGDDILLAKIKTGGGDIWGISLNGHNAGNPGPSSLYQIDRATGAGTLVGTDLGYAVNSIAIDPITGVMYASTPSWDGIFHGLLYVNTTTGTAAEIGPFEAGVVGLTFDSTGQLWGWAEWGGPWDGDDLVQIDKTTGAVTYVGNSGINSFSQVLAFDSSDTLFMIQEDSPPPNGDDQLVYTVDPLTGVGTLSHPLDFDPGSGGSAFDPATGLLWAAAGVQSGKIYDSVIRVSNIWANTYTDIDTDIEFLNAITISDAPYIEDATNTAPVANDDDYLALINTQLVIPAPGVLGNDYDLDSDAIKVKQLTVPAHGGIVMFADGSFTYTPGPDYCGPDSFTYIATDDPPSTPPSLDSNMATVSITVACGDNPPVAVNDAFGTAEDTELTVVAPGVLENDSDLDGDPIAVTWNSDATHGVVSVAADGSVTYIPSDDYCGPDSFTYVVTDSPPFHPPQESAPATVDIWVDCVNDPPVVTSVTPGTGIVDYSDYITQVTITIEDIDSDLRPNPRGIRFSPDRTVVPANLPDPRMKDTKTCDVVPNETVEYGTICTFTLDGQIGEPGEQTYTIGFKGFDEDGAGPDCTLSEYYPDVSVCQHILTVEPEHAMVKLDEGNPIDELAPPGEDSEAFSLWFSAWEISGPEEPLHGGATAPGDLNNMVPYMTLKPVGPGIPVNGVCDWDDELDGGPDPAPPKPLAGEEYAQVAFFQCDFDQVPVNTYEIDAGVEGGYYQGFDEGILVVYDPSLGHITGGGFFYWPETEVPQDACLEYECLEYECAVFDTTECLEFNYEVCLDYDEEACLVADPCAGYLGDKTNFGFNFKYNKKQKNILGNLLMMRHTIDESCIEGNYKVKSNAIDGMGLGTATDDDGDYGWAAVTGKATFRDPEEINSGGNTFLLYVEDHGDQGCSQNPQDEFWVEVDLEPRLDGPTIWPDPLPREPADEDPAIDGEDVPIFCGNIVVPHETGEKGGGKDKPEK